MALVFNGQGYEMRGDDAPGPAPTIGDMPKKPQKVKLRPSIKVKFHSPSDKGNGYQPGELLSLGHDQCRYTIDGKIMCGAKTLRPGTSWCGPHLKIVLINPSPHALEPAQ